MTDYPIDRASNGGIRPPSIIDMEHVALDFLTNCVTTFGRMVNRGHPATYFATADGTFMVTVERISSAVQAPPEPAPSPPDGSPNSF